MLRTVKRCSGINHKFRRCMVEMGSPEIPGRVKAEFRWIRNYVKFEKVMCFKCIIRQYALTESMDGINGGLIEIDQCIFYFLMRTGEVFDT